MKKRSGGPEPWLRDRRCQSVPTDYGPTLMRKAAAGSDAVIAVLLSTVNEVVVSLAVSGPLKSVQVFNGALTEVAPKT